MFSLSLSLSLFLSLSLSRRSGALWFESQVLLTTVAEVAFTNSDCRPPADFCNMTQMVLFPINATESRIIVEIDDDDLAEDTETFIVELRDATNAVIDETRNHAKIWITDTEDCEWTTYYTNHVQHSIFMHVTCDHTIQY